MYEKETSGIICTLCNENPIKYPFPLSCEPSSIGGFKIYPEPLIFTLPVCLTILVPCCVTFVIPFVLKTNQKCSVFISKKSNTKNTSDFNT